MIENGLMSYIVVYSMYEHKSVLGECSVDVTLFFHKYSIIIALWLHILS